MASCEPASGRCFFLPRSGELHTPGRVPQGAVSNTVSTVPGAGVLQGVLPHPQARALLLFSRGGSHCLATQASGPRPAHHRALVEAIRRRRPPAQVAPVSPGHVDAAVLHQTRRLTAVWPAASRTQCRAPALLPVQGCPFVMRNHRQDARGGAAGAAAMAGTTGSAGGSALQPLPAITAGISRPARDCPSVDATPSPASGYCNQTAGPRAVVCIARSRQRSLAGSSSCPVRIQSAPPVPFRGSPRVSVPAPCKPPGPRTG